MPYCPQCNDAGHLHCSDPERCGNVKRLPVLTDFQRIILKIASERENGLAKGDIPHGWKRRTRGAWWRNIDQLEARGLVARIGYRYVATPAGDKALSQRTE